jgi:hypothetical protein
MKYEEREPTQDQLDFLYWRGFIWTEHGWDFWKDGKIYDLSAVDLFQIDRIEKEGIFIRGAQ